MQAGVLAYAVTNKVPGVFMVPAGILVYVVEKVPEAFIMQAVVGVMQWLHDLSASTDVV